MYDKSLKCSPVFQTPSLEQGFPSAWGLLRIVALNTKTFIQALHSTPSDFRVYSWKLSKHRQTRGGNKTRSISRRHSCGQWKHWNFKSCANIQPGFSTTTMSSMLPNFECRLPPRRNNKSKIAQTIPSVSAQELRANANWLNFHVWREWKRIRMDGNGA